MTMRKILVTSQLQTKKDWTNLWLEQVAWSRPNNGQQEVGSRERFHHPLMDQRPGCKYEELIDDWLDLAVLEKQKNEVQR